MAKSPNKTVVVTSYELALTAAARLVAYADVGEYLDDDGEIGTRQTQLAIDDIISLSISLRRLITTLDLYGYAKGISVPKLILELDTAGKVIARAEDTVDLWSLINKLVHSVQIDIYQFPHQVLPGLTFEQAYQLAVDRGALKFRPVCRIRSDSGQKVLFHLLALCEAGGEMLETAGDTASNYSIFLGSSYDP